MSKGGKIRAGEAFVELSTQDKSLLAGLHRAQQKLKAFASVVSKIGLGMSGMGAAALAPLGLLTKQFADVGSALNDMSARTGASVESLSELGYAASMTGADTETLGKAVTRMNNTIGEAAGGNKAAAESLAAVGVSMADLNGLSVDEAFERVGKAVASIEDPAARTAAAMDLFGKSGNAIVPALRELDALRGQARGLGLTFSTADAQAADALGDALDNVMAALGAMRNAGISALAGAFTGIAEWGASAAAAVGQFVRENAGLVRGVVAGLAGLTAVGGALTALGGSILLVGPALTALGAAAAFVASPLALIAGGLAAAGAAVAYFAVSGSTAAEKLATVWNWMQESATAAVEWIADAWTALSNYLAPVVSAIGDFITAAWQSVSDAVSPLVSATTSMISDAWAAVEPAIGPVLRWIQSTIVDVFAVASFAVKHWETLLAAAMLDVSYQVVRAGNVVEWVFTEVVPTSLNWFANHWHEVFFDILNGTEVILTNLGTNLANFFDAVVRWMSGDGFDFEWTGLTDGFRSSISELPTIAEREIGALEASLKRDLDAITTGISADFDREIAGVQRRAAGAAERMRGQGVAASGGAAETRRKLERIIRGMDEVGEQRTRAEGTFNAFALRALGGIGGNDKLEKNTAKAADEAKRLRQGFEDGRFVPQFG